MQKRASKSGGKFAGKGGTSVRYMSGKTVDKCRASFMQAILDCFRLGKRRFLFSLKARFSFSLGIRGCFEGKLSSWNVILNILTFILHLRLLMV